MVSRTLPPVGSLWSSWVLEWACYSQLSRLHWHVSIYASQKTWFRHQIWLKIGSSQDLNSKVFAQKDRLVLQMRCVLLHCIYSGQSISGPFEVIMYRQNAEVKMPARVFPRCNGCAVPCLTLLCSPCPHKSLCLGSALICLCLLSSLGNGVVLSVEHRFA